MCSCSAFLRWWDNCSQSLPWNLQQLQCFIDFLWFLLLKPKQRTYRKILQTFVWILWRWKRCGSKVRFKLFGMHHYCHDLYFMRRWEVFIKSNMSSLRMALCHLFWCHSMQNLCCRFDPDRMFMHLSCWSVFELRWLTMLILLSGHDRLPRMRFFNSLLKMFSRVLSELWIDLYQM